MASAKFLALLGSPGANRIWLVEVEGYNLATEAVQTFYFCDPGVGAAYCTEPGDTPANQIYQPLIREGGNFRYTQSLFRSDGSLGGESTPSLGEITIHNEDGAQDWLDEALSFAGRAIRVKLGGDGFAHAEFETIFAGLVAERPTPGEDSVTFRIRDLQQLLDKPVQDTLFAGTGGAEGGTDLKDQPKPVSLGRPRNATLPYLGVVEGTLAAYAAHDGTLAAYAAAHDQLYDRGVPLVYDAADPPAGGKWTKRAASGLYLLNGTPSSPEITADIKGSADGSYVETAAGVGRRLVTRYAGFADPAAIDTAAVTQADSDQPGAVGVFLRGGENLRDVLDRLYSPLLFSWGVDLQGKFTMRQVKAPTGTEDFALVEEQILALDTLPVVEPSWRRTLGWGRNFTVQRDSDLTGAFTSLVTNGTFGADANWTKGTGWTIGSSVATGAAGSQSDLSQTLAGAIQGQRYYVTFVVTRSAGTLQLRIDGADLGDPIDAAGTYRREFVAASTTPALAFRKDAAFAGTVDTVVVLPTRLEFVGQEYRAASAEAAAIKTAHLLATDIRLDSLLADEADAALEAARQLALFGARRRAFRVTASLDPLTVAVGQEVKLTHTRFGLAAGENFRVLVLQADLAEQQVTMTLWG